MRITGGSLRGRTLVAPEGRTTRPTSDRVREALLNILMHHDWGAAIGDPLVGARVLDAFGGTGALAFEALSRGAAHATLFDTDRQALKHIRENAAALKITDDCAIMPADATRPPQAAQPCTLVFLDPPYRKNLIPESLAALGRAGWIAPHALIVAETAKDENLALPENHAVALARTYGDTAVHFITLS